MKKRTPSNSLVFRLSVRDRQIILSGLSWIVGNYQLWVTRKQLPNARPDRSWAPISDAGIFNQDLMDSVLTLHARVLSLTRGGRVHALSSSQVALSALAVRVAVRRHRHGHTKLDVPRIYSTARRLLRRLEAARKRAKRAEIRWSGPDSYRESAAKCRKFIQWLRVHFLDCSCIRKRRAPATFQYRRILIDELVQWTRAELIERSQKTPAEADLRRLVRLALRYIRRGRTRTSVRDLSNDRLFAASYLATFVTIRIEKLAVRRTNEIQPDQVK